MHARAVRVARAFIEKKPVSVSSPSSRRAGLTGEARSAFGAGSVKNGHRQSVSRALEISVLVVERRSRGQNSESILFLFPFLQTTTHAPETRCLFIFAPARFFVLQTDSQARRAILARRKMPKPSLNQEPACFPPRHQLECLPREIPETGLGVRRNRAASAQSTPRASATSLHLRPDYARVRFGAILLAYTRRVTSCARVRRTEVVFRIPSGERVKRVPGAESITVRWLPRSRRAGNRPRMRCSTSGR